MKGPWMALALVPAVAGAQEMTVLPVVAGGAAPVRFEAMTSNVYTVPGGYMVRGTPGWSRRSGG